VTVVIETVADEKTSGPEQKTSTPSSGVVDRGPITATDPVRALLDKQSRGEPLTANEQALLDLLRQPPKANG
jgi:hypothetical protein